VAHPDAIQLIPENAPAWTENAVFAMYDSAARVSVWAHWGRFPGAQHVWEGFVGVFLPDGGLLISRGFGASAREDEASCGALGFRCDEPGEHWSVRFDGMARPASQAELAAGPLTDGAVEHVAIDLAFTAVHPIYGGAAAEQEWATAHFDQGGRITGSVVHDGVRYAIDSQGFRDHSYGPRDYSTVIGDTWCTAVFPSGRALLAVEVWQESGPTYFQGFLFDDPDMHPATALDVPRLSALDGSPHAFSMTITTDKGVQAITVEQQASMALTFGRPVGLVAGARTDDTQLPVITEGPARVTWDGETTDGWIEKSMRVTHMAA
jgi:hypothetical protein